MQVSVTVFERLATAVLPLAATLPRVSVMAQFRVSAAGALVLKASWKVLPEAKIRVPSALGLSAEVVALPEPADVAGHAQLNFAAGLAVTFKASEPPVLFVPPPPATFRSACAARARAAGLGCRAIAGAVTAAATTGGQGERKCGECE